jgi:translation initiation factor 2B subunit (eIF-2B alpha/beta/delta family)
MKRPVGWLETNDEFKAEIMERTVEALWHQGAESSEYTPHDLKHFERVENWIRALIPVESWPLLSPQERKILTWSAWTHDIGMFKGLFPPGTAPNDIRLLHPDQAATWVADKWSAIGLERMEAQVIADLIRFHSRSNSLKNCHESCLCAGAMVRPRLLAAYLRLADALDVTHDRVDEPYRFELLVRQISPESDDTLFHWVKSFVVSAIAVDHKHQLINIQFINYSGPNQRHFELIKRYVINEIEDELASVEKILSAGGISSFHSVTTMDQVTVRGELHDQLAGSIERVLGWAQMTQSPNSTAVTVAALGAIRALIEETQSLKLKNPSHAWNAFRTGLQRLIQSLLHQLRLRRCHNELRRIFDFLSQVSYGNQFKDEFDDSTLDCLSRFTVEFTNLIRADKDRDKRLATGLESVLKSLCRSHSAADPWTFLLFGCSETVARVLAEFGKNHKLSLVISEGRPKTQHGAHNVPSYIDAEAYAERLHSTELEPSQLYVIPDACVASTLDRGMMPNGLPPIDAILFGANGVYFEPEIRVAHSAGHLMCAICAKHFGIPVIVVTSATKISPKPEPGGERLSRRSRWFSSDEELIGRLEQIYKAKTNWNPREDQIPFQLIASIITDLGIIKDFGGTDDAKEELLKQMQEVNDLLTGAISG